MVRSMSVLCCIYYGALDLDRPDLKLRKKQYALLFLIDQMNPSEATHRVLILNLHVDLMKICHFVGMAWQSARTSAVMQ